MTSPAFAFCLTLLLGGAVCGPATLHPLAFDVGEDATLPCFYNDTVTATTFNWYRQSLGQKPELMSTFYKHNKNGAFDGKFKKNPRLGLETGAGGNHLKISNVQFSDSGIYYCMRSYLNVFEFAEGFFLTVNRAGWKIQTSVSRSPSLLPGGSVTFNCIAHTGTCDQPGHIHWFKESGAHPGIIYTQEGGSQRCWANATAQTQTCEYKLLMEDLGASHAGTYYCVVASCGRILFGEGTTLEYEKNLPVSVYILSGALVFTSLLTVFLAYSAWTLRRTLKRQGSGQQPEPLETSAPNAEDEENLHYAAFTERRVSRMRRQKNQEECVYSSVKH